MDHISFDVIVLGSGAAGLRAALSAREAGLSVGVVSKGNPGKSTCTGFSAGVMAGSASAAQRNTHLQRTLTAGRGLNERELVEILIEEAPLRLNELLRWGIRADDLDGYLYAQGHPPALGMEIVRCLLKRNEALGTRFLGNLLVTDLQVRNGTAGLSACRCGQVMSNEQRATSKKSPRLPLTNSWLLGRRSPPHLRTKEGRT
jgi:L-aspartate oxidase